MTKQIDYPDMDNPYVMEGRTLRDLFKIASRFNDGMKLSPDERRDLAQAMQAKLTSAMPLTAPQEEN